MLVTPMHAVTGVLLNHLKEVFAENHEKGNFHLDPETDMYIRADFPEADSNAGFKPGIVLKTVGGMQDQTPGIGEQGYAYQTRMSFVSSEAIDDIYGGAITLQAISQYDQEALTLAYLVMVSINKFTRYLVGNQGITFVRAEQFTDSYPYKAGSHLDAFASDVQIRYAKRELFRMDKGEDSFESFNVTFNPKT